MITVFWWLAVVISIFFFIVMLIIFVCQWIIYFRVERTTLEQQKIARHARHDRIGVKR